MGAAVSEGTHQNRARTHRRQFRERPVGAPVVHDEDLEAPPGRRERVDELAVERVDIRLFVADGDDDREIGRDRPGRRDLRQIAEL